LISKLGPLRGAQIPFPRNHLRSRTRVDFFRWTSKEHAFFLGGRGPTLRSVLSSFDLGTGKFNSRVARE